MSGIDPASLAMFRDSIGSVGGTRESVAPAADLEQGGADFGTTLAEMVKETVASDSAAHKAVENFAQGKQMDLHDTMMTMEKGDISLKFMVNVRNKVVDAYKEIMRMGG